MTSFSIRIVRCRNLPAKDADGFSDPYVKLKLGTQGKQKTKVVKKTLNPEFNQEFKYSHWGSSEKLTASVWDWNRVAKKVFIGQVVFPHPDKGTISGAFPLTNEKGDVVGGTMEVVITSEYLMGLERRASLSRRRSSADRPLTIEADEKKLHILQEKLSPSDSDEGFTSVSPSTSPVLIHGNGLDDSRQRLAFSPEARERERDVEMEREKERAAEREKEKIREKERAEEKARFAEMIGRFGQLEEENKKQSAVIENLERQLEEVRRTVAGLEEWSNEGKAHASNSTGCTGILVRLFPCCFSANKRAASKKDIIKLEEDSSELTHNKEIRTNGSI